MGGLVDQWVWPGRVVAAVTVVSIWVDPHFSPGLAGGVAFLQKLAPMLAPIVSTSSESVSALGVILVLGLILLAITLGVI